jgi:hypothetical protein
MKKLPNIGLSILLATAAPLLGAAPVGYSINSDSAGGTADSLYRVDLGLGTETLIGPVLVGNDSRIDVEGLAFAPDGTLYGIDDSEMTLFPINPASGLADASLEVRLSGLPGGGGNDFGMTFTCDGSLYVTSVARDTLYRLSLNGVAEPVGTEGSLGANIGALAAWGNPVQLFGLGNGLDANQNEDVPALFRIDPGTGIATEIGALGAAVGDYAEGGLAFDDAGQLWAITDRRDRFGGPQPSEVMRIDTATGTADQLRILSETGFESLAVSTPGGCIIDDDGPGGDDSPVDVSVHYPGVPALGPGGLAALFVLLLAGGLIALRRP